MEEAEVQLEACILRSMEVMDIIIMVITESIAEAVVVVVDRRALIPIRCPDG